MRRACSAHRAQNAKCPPVSHVPVGIFINDTSIDASLYASRSTSLTHSFLMVPTSACSASTTCGRMSPPISTSMIAACQPHAHIADTRHRARGLDSRPYLFGVVVKDHAAHPVAWRHAIGLDSAHLGLGRRAHHTVMRQIHPTACRRSIGLGLTQPSINRRHQFATLEHHFSLTVVE